VRHCARVAVAGLAALLLPSPLPGRAQSAGCKTSVRETTRIARLIFETAEAVKSCAATAPDRASCESELDRIKSMADTIVTYTETMNKECVPGAARGVARQRRQ
jgi:hypothetical protein